MGRLGRDPVQVREAESAVAHRAVVHDAAPVVEHLLRHVALDHADGGGVLFLRSLEAVDPLVEIPTERPDHADVVVVPHVAVGDDIQSRLFLVADDRRHGVGVHLFVLHFLECHANVAAEQLLLEPLRPWIRADHRGREKLVNNLRCHVVL